MRLLLAFTKSDLRLSLDLLLSEQAGVHIVGTASESEGLLALIHTTRPDMVLADWDLPKRPFPQILPEINLWTQRPKIFILTKRDSDIPLALHAGADAAVVKGASPDLLLLTFQNLRQKTISKERNNYE